MIQGIFLQNLLEIMKVMADTELLFAEFYRNCAETWEDDREFWMGIVVEEEKHARNIEKMSQLVSLKPERFEIGRPFNQMSIRTIMTGVNDNLKRLREGLISNERALLLARDMENSVIEKNYGEIVRTSDIEYLNLLKEIVQETVNHRKGIEQRIQILKEGGAS